MADDVRSPLSPGLAGTVLSGRYKLDSKLGSGGMSTVYLAHDETLERWVAVKLLHREISDQPDQLERFRREARAVAQLSHPNVVSVIDAGEDGGHPYIVFEYVSGETLKQRIDRLGRLPLDEAAAYAIETGRGLAAAHARKLIHRDVKPQNVLIDAEGRAKVTDFGIARSLESDGLTKTGRVLGTTDYVSPEQAMGQEVDARSDVYSLGVLLYEMLTGRPPFEADSLVGVAMKHVNEPMPDVQEKRPDASSALAAVVERSTLKEPKKRYSDMGAMLADLEGALEVEVSRSGTAHGEATTVLDTVSDRRRLLPSRRASLAGIGLVLAGTAAALLIAGLTGKTHDQSGAPPVPSGAEIPLKTAYAYDPIAGDGENDAIDQNAVDADTQSAWATSTYQNSPVLAEDGKAGVGLVIDAGKPASARTMEIMTVARGWNGDIYASASSAYPTTLDGWGEPIGHVSDATTDQQIQLNDTAPSRYFLIWLTRLSPEATVAPTGALGGYNVQIKDVKLFS
jgi:serine/threonine-protein kinase